MFTPHLVKSPTSNDVAVAAGVSRATVSFVLNNTSGARVSEDTRLRVRQAAHMLGYTPNAAARSLAGGHAVSGFLFPRPSQEFGTSVHNAFDRVLNEIADEGVDTITLGDAELSGNDAGAAWAKYRPESVLAEATRCDEDTTEVLRLSGVRALIVYGNQHVDYAPSLAIPQEPFGAFAAKHLIALGHRRLCFLEPTAAEFQEMSAGRLRGVRQICATTSVPLRVVPSDKSSQSLRDWAHSWKYDDTSPTGIIAVDGPYAAAAIRALKDAAVSVPSEVSVIAADENPVGADFDPSITSIGFDVQVLAGSLLTAFTELRSGTRVDEVPVPTLRLIERESTTRAPSSLPT